MRLFDMTERKRVLAALARTRHEKLLSDLTYGQWLETLEHFDWHCAYCRSTRVEVIEHFIPVLQGGGTTVGNCVPACSRCNMEKAAQKPIGRTMRWNMERVSEYLALRQKLGSIAADPELPPRPAAKQRTYVAADGSAKPTVYAIRKARGISREVLAVATKTRYQTLINLEIGKNKPSIDLAIRIAQYFGLPFDSIAWDVMAVEQEGVSAVA